jgi:hypothetical protein
MALTGDIKSTLTDLLSSGSKASGASAMTEALSSVAKSCTAVARVQKFSSTAHVS